jgi:hypothetical protein
MRKTIISLIIILSFAIGCKQGNYPENKIYSIKFDESKSNLYCDFIFPNPEIDSISIEMRTRYSLDSLTSNFKQDIEKALALINWTHNRWEHNGNNNPNNNNPIYLVEQGKKGQNFRCVEYGIVLSASLNSIGIPTRTLGLKTKDVETVEIGAGHVVSEAYIPDIGKWVFMDAQINYIPFLNGVPLNAVEYQKAILENKNEIELRDFSGPVEKNTAKNQMEWVAKYLYYFDVPFYSTEIRKNCKGKSKLMLVPLNAKEPKVFQRKSKMNYLLYTNNLNEFYKEPKYGR